ncbi:thioredoxin family protein [Sulfurimonas lithotrophica]|uniref:Thioredoxin family protein n=1 Tax=Sulfurimonas lithotrophica TaxID=2590022 RepID=A0A5P8P287_9BACT|nr:thioredoxin family protein [Sulfurimonas lithotrophica]QFR49848.1 thioredoxin family protein [Sulfurimonas lithotrophica]
MRNILVILLFSVVTLFATGVKWENDYHSALEKAKKQNKPVLFISSRHTCKYCVVLDETTLRDARVVEELNKDFISVVSYSDERDYMPRELWRPGTPAIWFLLPSGEPMFEPVMGAIDANNFLKALDIVKKEFKTRQKKDNNDFYKLNK